MKKIFILSFTFLSILFWGRCEESHASSLPTESSSMHTPSFNVQDQGQERKFPKLSEEQRLKMRDFFKSIKDLPLEQRQNALQNSDFFKSLSPEQQMVARRKMEQHQQKNEFQTGSGSDMEKIRELREKMKNLTPEQRQQIREFRQNAKNMSPEQRQEALSQLPLFKDMTDEQRQMLQKRMQKFNQMSPDQKEKLKKNLEKWKSMSPEQKDAFREKMKNQPPHGSEEKTAPPTTAS